jgi:endogenous inhibitor of DNA gyrase (YacG/DUF329 family)
MTEGVRIPESVIYFKCPKCGVDVPDDWDLPYFVRFYNRDWGQLDCPTCGASIEWQMRVWISR